MKNEASQWRRVFRILLHESRSIEISCWSIKN